VEKGSKTETAFQTGHTQTHRHRIITCFSTFKLCIWKPSDIRCLSCIELSIIQHYIYVRIYNVVCFCVWAVFQAAHTQKLLNRHRPMYTYVYITLYYWQFDARQTPFITWFPNAEFESWKASDYAVSVCLCVTCLEGGFSFWTLLHLSVDQMYISIDRSSRLGWVL